MLLLAAKYTSPFKPISGDQERYRLFGCATCIIGSTSGPMAQPIRAFPTGIDQPSR